MKIINVNEQPVKACAAFEYKGFHISSSSIMSQRSIVDSIMVFDCHGMVLEVGKNYASVEEAIAAVDAWSQS